MKTNMRNILLTGLILLAADSISVAQQTPGVEKVAPLPAMTTKSFGGGGRVIDDQVYFVDRNSERNFKEEDLKSKEVSKEIAAPKNAEIYIENVSRGVVIKTWDQQKVKVTTTVYYAGEIKLTDEEWLEKAGLSLKILGNSVKVKSGSVSNNSFYSYSGNTPMAATISGMTINGFKTTGDSKAKKILTITVPAGSKLDIESKYGDLQLPANIGDVTVDISNGTFEAENLNKLILRSKYSNSSVGDVKMAEVEITNGQFKGGNIDDLDIESKYSTIEMAAARKLVLHSTNDEYEVEDAGEVRGIKNFGNLRITKLNTSIDVDGRNADIKIRNIGSSLTMIKLKDEAASIRIPLRDTKNYAIDFDGNFSSVYGNFEKKAVTEVKDDKISSNMSAQNYPATKLYQARSGSWGETQGNGPTKFTAASGDGKGLKIDIKCQNCTVDFK